MRLGVLPVLGVLMIPFAAFGQVAAPAFDVQSTDYRAIRTWHEQYLATSPHRAERVEALRKIVRSGQLGDRGLQRIFNNFEGRMSIDPSIPGVEKTARLLASSNRSQVKGHTRELLYAAHMHTDGRNRLVQMNRRLDRPWGKTDADIVIRNQRTGLYGRIEVKNYSLKSQITNEAKLKAQISKMAREAKLTGQPQFWINRHGITPALRNYAKRSGVVTLGRVATGRRLPASTQSFDSALVRMDNQFSRVARRHTMLGGTMMGVGMGMLANTLPEARAAMNEVLAPGEASTAARARLASSGSYSIGAVGLMASGGSLAFAPLFSEVAQNRLYSFGKIGGLTSVAIIGVGVVIDVQRYRSGSIAGEQFWERAFEASAFATAGAAGAWVGGGVASIGTANPIAIGIGSVAGSAAGVAAYQYADGIVTEKWSELKRRPLDHAFGQAVDQRYGVTAPDPSI